MAEEWKVVETGNPLFVDIEGDDRVIAICVARYDAERIVIGQRLLNEAERKRPSTGGATP